MFRNVLMMFLLFGCVPLQAQFQVSLQKNAYTRPTEDGLWRAYDRVYLEGIVDTSMALRLGQWFEFTDGQRNQVRFDSVFYNGGGNNRKAIVAFTTFAVKVGTRTFDTTRTFALPYLTTDSSFSVTTLYNDSVHVRIGLEKILNVGPLSIAKLRVARYGVPVDVPGIPSMPQPLPMSALEFFKQKEAARYQSMKDNARMKEKSR